MGARSNTALPAIALDLPGNQVHDAPRYRQEIAPSSIGPHPQALQGIHPALIHAYQKTGRLVDKENRKHLTKAELKEWTDAVDEWYETHEG